MKNKLIIFLFLLNFNIKFIPKMSFLRKIRLLGLYGTFSAGLIYGGLVLGGKKDETKYLIGGLKRGMRCGIAGLIVARKYLKVN